MTTDPQRWKNAAQALDLGIPEPRVEAIAPILDGLMAAVRKALDRDLSLVEPVAVYRPQRAKRAK